MNSCIIEAIRFSCQTGKAKIIEIQAELGDGASGKVIRLHKGVTGYESFYVSSIDFEAIESRGWWACAGTYGGWDSLYIHGLQMKKLFNLLKVKRS